MVMVFINIANVFTSTGFGEALVQKKDADELDFSTVFFCTLSLSIVIYIILFIGAPYIAEFYHTKEIILVLRILSIKIVLSSIATVQHAYVQKRMIFKKFFFSTLGGTVISGILGIVLAYSGFGVWALVFQYLTNTIIDILVLLKTVPWHPRLIFSVERAKQLMDFGWKLVFSNLINVVYNESRSLIIGRSYSSADLAYYNKRCYNGSRCLFYIIFILEFMGIAYTEEDLYAHVLAMEQIMSTGGGWQDQVGGITSGLKYITSMPGLQQQLQVAHIELSPQTKKELDERFVLIYTGQRRLARNLLRDVVGRYVGNEPDSLFALEEIQKTAALMRFELERGNVDGFAKLLDYHWELSKKIDAGSSNTLIEQIFSSIEELVDGKLVCGAGGGGFLQVILKKGVTRQMVEERLKEVFMDSLVGVADCKLVWE